MVRFKVVKSSRQNAKKVEIISVAAGLGTPRKRETSVHCTHSNAIASICILHVSMPKTKTEEGKRKRRERDRKTQAHM